MTPQITREELEAIARAMGYENDPEYQFEYGVLHNFNPAPGGNPADNDAMCCELGVGIDWTEAAVIATSGDRFVRVGIHNFPTKQAAKAYASCKVVAAVQLEKEKQG